MNEEIKSDVTVKDTVLIDTWWNVNTTEVPTTEAQKAVLIDTWWNVNIAEKLQELCKNGF